MKRESDLDALPARERAALDRTRTASRLLDEAIRVPGTDFRVGIDPILSLVPVSGDAVGAVCSLYIVAEAVRLGITRKTLLKMLTNVAVDTVGGSIPVVGSLVDAVWKANRRNVALLEDHLAVRTDIPVE